MSALSSADAAFVRELVYRRSAIQLDDAKEYLITSRLEQLVHDGAAGSVGQLVELARQGQPQANTRIVEAITTHETLFFRDVEPFEVMKRDLLPKWAAAGRRVVFWSAACSSGQEPYSLAMMLLENFPALVRAGATIIATDLSAQVLERAKAGRFRQLEVNRGLPIAYLLKHFQREGIEYQVKEPVRSMVKFSQLNLANPWLLPERPDVVLLRNVLIYFDLPTKAGVLGRVRDAIRPDGALFLGAAETTVNVHDGWERVTAGKTAWYQVRP